MTTRYGRSIRVTGDHSLFVEGPKASRARSRSRSSRSATCRDRTDRGAEPIARRSSMLDAGASPRRTPWDLRVEAQGSARSPGSSAATFGLLVSSAQQRTELAQRGLDEADPHARDGSRAGARAAPPRDRVPEGARVRLRSAGRSVPLPAGIAITDALLWLLGLWVAEGCIAERANGAHHAAARAVSSSTALP